MCRKYPAPSNCEDDQISATPGLSDTVPASPHISRCAGKAGNPFQTTQGNRLPCRDQEGHERLPELPVVPCEKPHTGTAAPEKPRDSPNQASRDPAGGGRVGGGWEPRRSAGRRESGSQRPWLGEVQEKKALISRCRGSLVVFLELRCQCGVSHKVRLGAQGASRVVSGKSSLHTSGEGAHVIALESW